MKFMDMIQNHFKDLSIQGREEFFNQFFSMGTNTNASIKDKFELLYLICFLSFKMRERDPEKFKKPLNVLQHLYGRTFSDQIGEDSYLIALSILCDDLLFGVNEIEKPEGFTNVSEIFARIKDLVNHWLPF